MNLFSLIMTFALASWLAACNDLSVLSSDLPTRPTISDLNKSVAQPGDTVTVEGTRLSEKIKVLVGGEKVELTNITPKEASFVIPSTAESGPKDIEFSYNGVSFKTLPLWIGDESNVMNVASDSICDDTIFRDTDGKVVRGKRDCKVEKKSSELCKQDGQVDCLASAEFPAVDKANVLDSQSAKFSNSLTIAGVTGTLANCSADGEENCINDGVEYRAAKLSGFSENDIRIGLSVAGVSGTMLDATPRSCASDGDLGCLANAAFPAVDKAGILQANAAKIRSDLTIAGVAGALNDCSADGATGCVAIGPSYAAASVSGAAAKILAGQSLGGVAGTAPIRPGDCSSDGQSSCVAVANYPAVKKADLTANAAKIRSAVTIAGVSGTLADCAADGSTICVAVTNYPSVDKNALTTNASKIRSGTSIASVAGTFADCAADGATDCAAVSAFPAADQSSAAAKILSGQTLAGVSGTAAARPADCASDGGTNCVAIAAYPAAIAAGAAAKVLTGQTLAGVNGSAAAKPADCAADGATNCVAVANYPSVDKSALTSNAAKIRSSISIASVSGTLSDCSSDGDSGCVAVGPSYAAAVIAGAAAKILTGQSVAGINGSAAVKPADCAADGATNCVAVASFPAADATGAAPKIVSGQSLAGISGSAAGVRPPDCGTDGETSCVSVTAYPAMQVAGAAAKIALGDTLAGVAGSASVRPSDCAADGATGCVAVTNYPSIDKSALTSNAAKIRSSVTLASVTGTLDDCTADGGTNCVAIATYPAALASGAASKILTGQTLAGVNGTAAVKPADCAADGATNCVAVTNYPAVDKSVLTSNAAKIRSSLTLASIAGTLADCSADGSTGCVAVTGFPAANSTGAAAKILTGQTLAGVNGSAAVKPADCAADGATNCVAVTNYPSVDKSALTANAGKIHSSLTLASIAGTLDDCAADGGTNCVAVAAYPAALASGASAKIITGQTLAGVNGSAAVKPADCAADGATNCVAVTNYPSVDKSALTANAAKIHSSLTLASVAGTLDDCAADGGTDCVAVAAYPAALAAGAAAKILTGQTLAGANGTAAARPADCSSDGGTNCVAVANYPSVDKSALTSNATKIRSSVSIASVSGTLDDCANDGEAGCVAVGPTYAAALLTGAAAKILTGQTLAGVNGSAAGRPADCSSDGGTNCVAVAGYPAANGTGAAAKILTGQTLAGINGSAAIKPADCAADGGINCVAVTNYPAVDKTALTNNAGKIRSSVTLASVTGTLDDCAADAGTNCVAVAAYPAALASGAAAKILTGQTLAGVNGTAAIKPADCAGDGDTNCVAVAAYPAALASGAAAKILTGQTLAGVSGSAAIRPADCAADGGTSCVAVAAYPAALASGAAAKILTGQTLAGINGSAAVKPADCAADGATDCVTVTNYPSVDKSALTSNAARVRSGTSIAGVSGSLADCSADGGTTCVAVAAYPAALASGAAAKILTGQTLAGVAGSAAIRPADCSSDGGTSCVAITNYPAVDKSALTSNAVKIRSGTSIAGVSGSLADCSADGESTCVAVAAYPAALASGAAAKILTGQTLAGVAGSAAIRPADCAADGSTGCVTVTNYPSVDKVNNITANAGKIRSSVTIAGVAGTLADCSSDNGTNCVAVTNFPSVVKANVTVGVVKSGTVIAGVSGVYPNATYPLTGADGTADLDSATFNAKIKASTAFEWFDSAGARYTGAGDTDITAANIKTGIDVFGTTGTFGANCTGDGQTSCITTSRYKSMDTDSSVITAWDIRIGKTAGGISGNINFYKSMAKLTTNNRTSGTGANTSSTVADFYDTIDDYYTGMPTDIPPGFGPLPGSNWVRDPASDTGLPTGTASNGICDGTEACAYLDQTTGLYWAKADATTRTWETAITYCDGLSPTGGYSDWRLPTQKELYQAYIDGLWSQKTPLALTANYYWTATAQSDDLPSIWAIDVSDGNVSMYAKTASYRTFCVR